MANERLIDANALIEKLSYRLPFNDRTAKMLNELVDAVQKNIENAPTVDAVPVVRCKDCKYFDTQSMECQCDYVSTDNEGGASYSINFGPDDFCSYGERRSDE